MNTKRTFLQKSLSKGLECDMITAEDLLHHTSAEVLAHHLPNDLKAKLIKASLDAKEMSAELVVETLGTVAMAANLPPHTIWNCLAEAAERALGGTAIDIAPAELGESKSTSKPESASKSKTSKTTSSSKSKPTTRSRHIDIQHFAIQEWRERGIVKMQHIPGVINPSDQATKALGWTLHSRHIRRSMGHHRPV